MKRKQSPLANRRLTIAGLSREAELVESSYQAFLDHKTSVVSQLEGQIRSLSKILVHTKKVGGRK